MRKIETLTRSGADLTSWPIRAPKMIDREDAPRVVTWRGYELERDVVGNGDFGNHIALGSDSVVMRITCDGGSANIVLECGMGAGELMFSGEGADELSALDDAALAATRALLEIVYALGSGAPQASTKGNCSFCEKPAGEVRVVRGHTGAQICEECATLVAEILDEEE